MRPRRSKSKILTHVLQNWNALRSKRIQGPAMKNLERRLRNLETRRSADEEIVIEIEYVNEPPKSAIDERDGQPRWPGTGPRVTTICLHEDDLRL